MEMGQQHPVAHSCRTVPAAGMDPPAPWTTRGTKWCEGEGGDLWGAEAGKNLF